MFKRIGNLLTGLLSRFISGIERKNPEALLEAEQENLRAEEANFNQSLIPAAGLCESLKTQIKDLNSEVKELTAKITAHLRAGNKEAASQYALHLQEVQNQLATNIEQQTQAEENYKNLVRSRDVSLKAAKSRIEKIKYGIADMKNKQAQAALTEMASQMITSIGGAADNLGRLEDMVKEETTHAAGRIRVAQGTTDMSEVILKEGEQKALADQALAEFAAKAGISLDTGTAVPATPAKVMGGESA
jgi:phage shock protein A